MKDGDAPTSLSWRVHPAKSRPKDTFLLAAVVFITTAVVMSTIQSVLLTVLTPLVLMAATSAFWLPTHYRIEDGLLRETRGFSTKSRELAHMRRFEHDKRMGLVSPFSTRRFLDRYRGMLFHLAEDKRDRIVAAIEAQLGGDRGR